MTSIQHRRHKRYETNQKISFKISDGTCPEVGLVCNISKTGLLLESSLYIPEGEDLALSLTIGGTPVHLKGTCVYCLDSRKDPFQYGIYISKINTAGMEPFLAFIKQLEQDHKKGIQNLQVETDTQEDIVLRVSGEHKLIAQYVVLLQEMLNKIEAPELSACITLLSLMKKELTAHFYLEEKVFFKICLAHLPEKEHPFITTLTQEHALLTYMLDEIKQGIHQASEQKKAWGAPLRESIQKFINDLRNHAKKEITDLFPLLEAHAEAKSELLSTLQKIATD